MGNNVNNSSFMKKMQETIMNETWLKSLYANAEDQKVKLQTAFEYVPDSSLSQADQAKIQSQQEQYAARLETLEAKMAVLLEQIEKNQQKVDEKSQEVLALITASERKQDKFETEYNKWVENVISDVINDNDILPGQKHYEMKVRLQNFPPKYEAAVRESIKKLEGKQGEIDALLGDVSQIIAQKGVLEKQYGATKSIYELLNTNSQRIKAMNSDYTNSDLDSKVPVYSLEKTAIVQEIFETPAYIADGTKDADGNQRTPSGEKPTLDGVTQKYSEQITKGKTATKKCDIYSVDNQSVTALKEAIDGGMLDELRYAGLNAEEIGKFLCDNFGGAGFKYNDKGEFSIPKGHRSASEKKAGKSHAQSEAREIFNSVKGFFDNYSSNFQGIEDTWSATGNTMKSNQQISALGKFVNDGCIEKLANGKPAFTFKEAMYALFNSETGLFKDSGITYNLDDQDGEPKYFIQLAGDEETAKMYKDLADKVFDAWGVKANIGTSYEEFDGEEYEYEDTQHDPLSFMKDGSQYSFIIDRKDENGVSDGIFNGIEEFVGGKWNKDNPNDPESKTWLEDLKSLDTNDDNKLTENELKDLRLLRSTYTDNALTTKDASDKFLRSETTTIAQGFTDAASMGISEIDLSAFFNEDGTMNTDLVNNATGKNDINGSAQFDFKGLLNVKFADGEKIAVKRQDETGQLMSVIYNGALGKGFNVGQSLTAEEINNIIDGSYDEYAKFAEGFKAFFASINMLKGVGQSAKLAKETFEKTIDELKSSGEARVNKAEFQRISAERSNASKHAQEINEVERYAANNGLKFDRKTATGIRVSNASLTIEQIAINCHELLSQADGTNINNLATALNAIKLCVKEGINPTNQVNTQTIIKWIEDGEVETAEDIKQKIANEYSVSNQQIEDEYSVNVEEVDVEFEKERQDEILKAFVSAFSFESLGIADDNGASIVKALAYLCQEEMDNPEFNISKMSGNQLAKAIKEKYFA